MFSDSVLYLSVISGVFLLMIGFSGGFLYYLCLVMVFSFMDVFSGV